MTRAANTWNIFSRYKAFQLQAPDKGSDNLSFGIGGMEIAEYQYSKDPLKFYFKSSSKIDYEHSYAMYLVIE